MQILILSAFYYPHIGGYESYVNELSRALLLQGHKVIVLTSETNNAEKYEINGNLEIFRIKHYNLLNGKFPVPVWTNANLSLRKIFKTRNIDVVFTNTRFFMINQYALYYKKKFNYKIIHIEHGARHPDSDSKLVRDIAHLFDHTLGRRLISRADKVVGVSNAVSNFIQHIKKRDVGTLYNSIDTNVFKKNKNKSNKEIVITYVGRLIYAKGVQDLINATANIQNIKVLIVGSGDYEQQLKNDVKKYYNNSNKYIFLGSKNKKEINEILSTTDIFVNPSYSEGLPTSVLEAGSCNCAVIATDVGGTKEIIPNQNFGLLIKPKDVNGLEKEIIKLILNKKLRKEIGINLRKRIENNFSIKQFRSNLKNLLQSLK